MLSDRSYMRDPRPSQRTSALVWLIAAIIAGYLLQNIFLRWFDAGAEFTRLFALSTPGLKSGKVWTLFTYSFLHNPHNLLHIVGNLLGLYFLGRELLPVMGNRRFVSFYFAAALAGGLLWTAAHWQTNSMVIGASAAVMGMLVVFSCLYPNEQVTFLLFFVIPINLKPKYVAWALLAFDLFGFIFFEIMGEPSPFGLAHSAHLGGMAAGWIYFRYLHNREWHWPRRRANIELPAWARKKLHASAPAAPYRVNLGQPADLKAEVDRILDKINSRGFGSLTPEEKQLLDDAKDLLSRH